MLWKLDSIEWVNDFCKPKCNPTYRNPDTSTLSPYISFGSLSCKTLFW